jgi:hypothetical protein
MLVVGAAQAHILMLWLDEYARQQACHALPLTAYYPCLLSMLWLDEYTII